MRRRAMFALALALALPAGLRAQDTGAAPSPAAFWQTVGDSTLGRLVTQALAANRDLRAAGARVDDARAARVNAGLDLIPSVTLSSGYSRQRLASASFPGASGQLPDQSVWDAGLHMSWEVDVFGRLRRSYDARAALVASVESDMQDVQVELVAAVARTYFDLRGAQDRMVVAQRNAENQDSTLRLTQDRLELGRGNALDVERAQAQLSSTLATIPAVETEISTARHRLATLLGGAPGPIIDDRVADVCSPAPALIDVDIDDVNEAISERPDVRAARSRVAASRALVGAAKADYLPRLTIGAVAGYTASEFDALGQSGTPRYAIGPVISWPLLDLGKVRTRVDAARAGQTEAQALYEQALLAAAEEVETAMDGYRRARERLALLEDAAGASRRATELARLRFEEGATDFLEVLDAEGRLLDAEDRLAAGRTEATNWLVAVYRALGGRLPGAGSDVRDGDGN